ncbi:MAG: SMI1/KNR4 family protein [Cellulophaga fucicola]
MKKLKVIEEGSKILEVLDFEIIEKKFKIKFPDFLKDFLVKYEGDYFGSLFYKEEPVFKEILYLRTNNNFASIESILEGHLEEGIKGFVPFAIDSTGWDYCVSINQETYGQVWVDKFDNGEENPMDFVSESFENFISNLGSEEDIV